MPKIIKYSKPLTGCLCILLAAVLWGTAGTVQTMAPEGAQPEVLGAIRLVISGVVLLVPAKLTKQQNKKKRWAIFPTICAAVSVAALQVCFFSSLPKIGVALGTSVFIGSFPVFTGILAFIIYRKKPTLKWLFATLLAIIGCTLLLDIGANFKSDYIGVTFALGAGVFYAIFTLSIQSLLREHSSVAVMATTFSLGAVLLIPTLFGGSLTWLNQASGLMVCLYLGIVATVIPYLLFARGLRIISASTAATLNLAEPLTAALLGIFLLHESLSLKGLMGMFFLIGGIAVLSFNWSGTHSYHTKAHL